MNHVDLSFLTGFIDENVKWGETRSIFEFDALDEVPMKSGAYILLSGKQKFIYPNGLSRVVYIGKSINLYHRLKSHQATIIELKNLNPSERINYWYYSRYQYLAKFDCQVYWFKTNTNQNPKKLESIMLDAFYSTFHALPIGNGAFSF